MVRDATKNREEIAGTMDGVLLDAPCTGLGFMAQKPDLKLRVTEESLKELTELQEKLLDTVSAYVKPGGTLVYSTCSIFKDESERQAEAFLQRHPEFEEVELPKSIPEKYRTKRDRGLQLLEYRDGMEGFYLIRMKRKYD
jgi:16S rRNA (cytosine967-C5)-methyltransferase